MINFSDFSDSKTIVSVDMASGVLLESQVLLPNASSDASQLSVSLSSGSFSDKICDSGYSSPPSEITQETAPDSHDGKQDKSLVIPDMFSSIMAADPVVNPNYFKVKSKGDAWIQWYFKPLFAYDRAQVK